MLGTRPREGDSILGAGVGLGERKRDGIGQKLLGKKQIIQENGQSEQAAPGENESLSHRNWSQQTGGKLRPGTERVWMQRKLQTKF